MHVILPKILYSIYITWVKLQSNHRRNLSKFVKIMLYILLNYHKIWNTLSIHNTVECCISSYKFFIVKCFSKVSFLISIILQFSFPIPNHLLAQTMLFISQWFGNFLDNLHPIFKGIKIWIDYLRSYGIILRSTFSLRKMLNQQL